MSKLIVNNASLPFKGSNLKVFRSTEAGTARIACTVTFLLFLLCDAVYGIFPLGEKTVVWCDMEQQAVPLLLQLRELLRQGGSIAYSPLDAGGMQFYGVFCFFLSNPLSFLIFVTDIPADQLVTLLVIIKLSLASGTAAFWLRYRVRDLPAAFAVLLGVMYGCSGYGLFYYQNLMWLDIMVMFPLLMVSLRMLLRKGKVLPYLLTLCTIMLLCFYICYMVVLFVLIYTAISVRMTVPEKRRGLIAGKFWGASILAACFTAFVWLPCLIQVMHSARGGGLGLQLAEFGLLGHLDDKTALLGCTGIGFAALPSLFAGEYPHSAAKRRDQLLFLLLAAAVLLDPVNLIWHTGSYQAFPLRWGMIPILLLLTAAAKQLADRACTADQTHAGSSRTNALLVHGISIGAVITLDILFYLKAEPILHSYIDSLWVSPGHALLILIRLAAVSAAYAFVISGRQMRTISLRTCTVLLSVLFLCEFSLNSRIYYGAAASDDGLYAQTMSAAHQITPNDPTARLRLTKKYAHANMLGALGYPTMAHYTSLTRADYLRAVKRMGYSSYWMEVPSTGGTVLSDAVWNVQYQLGVRSDFPSWAEPVWTDGLLSIAQSSITLPSARYLDASPEEIADLPQGSRADVQRMLAAQLPGLENAVTEYAPTALHNLTLTTDENGQTVCTLTDPAEPGEIRFALNIPSRQALYFDLYSQTGTELCNERNGAASVQYNGITVNESFPENNSNGLVFLGEPHKQYVLVRIRVQHDFVCESFGVFGIDLDLLETAAAHAAGTVLGYENGVYTAYCKTDAPKTLVMAVAYDEGFTAEVNGEPAAVFRVNGCQTAVRIPAGESSVVLRFHVQGLRAGFLIGCCGLLLAVLWMLLHGEIPARIRQILNRFAASALQAVYRMLLISVYCLPLLIWLLLVIQNIVSISQT